MEKNINFEKYEKARMRGELIFYGGIALLGISIGIGYVFYNHYSKLEQKTQESVINPTNSDISEYKNSINYFDAQTSHNI